MKHSRLPWGIAVLVVTISFGPSLTHGQQENSKQRDLTKYPIVDFAAAADPSDAAERERKKEKDKRYEKRPFIITKPQPDVTGSTLFDNELRPESAFPFKESKLVITGVILGSLMSSTKSTVYSEYSVRIERILKQAGQEIQVGQLVDMDRMGGRVRYPNGAVILYLNDWQDLPELCERYLFFLDAEDHKNPNYKLITA